MALASDVDPVVVHRQPGVPLYYQIQHLLRDRIDGGVYPERTRIPSEVHLSRELAVSRVTLRVALRQLVQEGLLVKVQGKGNFVTASAGKFARVRNAGFVEDQERICRLRVTDVEVSPTAVTAALRETLRLGAEATNLTSIKRLSYLDDEPYSYALNYLPEEIGARLRVKDLYSGSLLKLLQEHLKIPVLRAQETIDAATAQPDTAHRLGIPLLYPVLHLTRMMFTTQNRPVVLADTFYRADRYQYVVSTTRVRRRGAWIWTTEVGMPE